MKKINKGFSIVIAMGLVLLINLLALSVLEYIVPFSKNTKGIENSTSSYYEANSGIESALFAVKNTTLGSEPSDSLDGSEAVDYSFSVLANGKVLPPPGSGNSQDSNFNKISQGNPIQIEIGNNNIIDFDDVEFAFRVPTLDGDFNSVERLISLGLPIINWQISAEDNTLNALTGNYLKDDDICVSNIKIENISSCAISLDSKKGMDLNEEEPTINDFYTSNCGMGKGCILKLSIVNKLEKFNGGTFPFLEWRITTTGDELPLRYSIINSKGKSYGYKKELEIKVPQETVSEAFDFTVFQ